MTEATPDQLAVLECLARADDMGETVEALRAVLAERKRHAKIRAYLRTGAWDAAREILEASERWEADVAEGKRILIAEAKAEKKSCVRS